MVVQACVYRSKHTVGAQEMSIPLHPISQGAETPIFLLDQGLVSSIEG